MEDILNHPPFAVRRIDHKWHLSKNDRVLFVLRSDDAEEVWALLLNYAGRDVSMKLFHHLSVTKYFERAIYT